MTATIMATNLMDYYLIIRDSNNNVLHHEEIKHKTVDDMCEEALGFKIKMVGVKFQKYCSIIDICKY